LGENVLHKLKVRRVHKDHRLTGVLKLRICHDDTVRQLQGSATRISDKMLGASIKSQIVKSTLLVEKR